MNIPGPVLDDPIHVRMPGEEAADPGSCQQRDLGLREPAIEGHQGGQGEHRIPQPVHLAYQDPTDLLRINVDHSQFIAGQAPRFLVLTLSRYGSIRTACRPLEW